MMGLMSELHIMLSNGDTIEQIADWIILLNFNRGTHITRQGRWTPPADFGMTSMRLNVLLNIG